MILPRKLRHACILLRGHGGSISEVLQCLPVGEYADKYNMLFVIPELGDNFYLDRKNIPGEKDFIVSEFLSKELLSYMKHMYPLKKNGEYMLGGYSMGGHGAMLHGLSNPDVFSNIISVNGAFAANEIALGSSFLVGTPSKLEYAKKIFMIPDHELVGAVLPNDVNRNPEALVENLMILEKDKALPNIFLTCSTKDIWYHGSKRIHNKLNNKGITCYYKEFDGEHDFDVFDKGFQYAFDIICSTNKVANEMDIANCL